MTRAIKIIPVLLLALVTASQSVAAAGDVPVRRYLLSAGANNGGKGRVMLRYAVSDADMFASVLIDMGGVERNNALILANPNVRELLGGISDLNGLIAGDRAEAPDVRNEVFIYYSGHADETGLKLGGETLSWADFRNAVDGIGSDVKVAVLDACGSGAITRAKGGVAQPVFMTDASSNMKGYAYLTSSNENEISQESDRIKGSFFTHALVSGMRGAADMTGNGRVTVNEAYTYAFNETLQNTQNTRAGTQHPSRDMNLTGTGDIVMTDLRQTSATLSLDPEIEGRFFIWDANGRLFSELRKMRGRPIELGLPPGEYIVRMEAPSRIWSAGSVTISDGGRTAISMNNMRPMGARKRTVARGVDEEGGDGDDGADTVDNIEGAEYLCAGDDLPDELAAICEEESAKEPAAEIVVAEKPVMEKTAVLSDTLTTTATDTATAATARSTRPSLDSACAAPHRFNVNAIAVNRVPESGLQLSFGNKGLAEFCGTQIGIFNALHKDSRGVQVGVVNMSRGYLDGSQIGWWMNIASDTVRYVQGGAFNIARYVGFVQGGPFNIAQDVGFVQGGAFNIARDVGAIQGGTFNIARDVGAIQGGTFNIARDVKYVQGGVFNIAGSVGSVQAGVLNIAGRAGRQIGVLNISRYSEKTPVGVLSIVGNGIIDLTAYADAARDFTWSLRTGMPWFYTLIEYNYNELNSVGSHHATGWGLGTRFGMNGPFTINLDALTLNTQPWDWEDYWNDIRDRNNRNHRSSRIVNNDNGGNGDSGDDGANDDNIVPDDDNKRRAYWSHQIHKLRLGASYNPFPFVAVTAGLSLNMNIERPGFEDDTWKMPSRFGSVYSREFMNGRRLHAWPGLYAGLTVGKVRATKRERAE